MENYKEVIAKYKDVDPYDMTEDEYKELKAAELADMQWYVDQISKSDVPEVMYRIGRPITDLKMMMETGVEAFGDKVLYHQIMLGDDHYTEFSYGQVRDDVRALGTAMLGLGLKGAHVGLIGANCYEWAESYFAVTGGVGVAVPLDKELTKEEETSKPSSAARINTTISSRLSRPRTATSRSSWVSTKRLMKIRLRDCTHGIF